MATRRGKIPPSLYIQPISAPSQREPRRLYAIWSVRTFVRPSVGLSTGGPGLLGLLLRRLGVLSLVRNLPRVHPNVDEPAHPLGVLLAQAVSHGPRHAFLALADVGLVGTLARPPAAGQKGFAAAAKVLGAQFDPGSAKGSHRFRLALADVEKLLRRAAVGRADAVVEADARAVEDAAVVVGAEPELGTEASLLGDHDGYKRGDYCLGSTLL